MLTVCAVGIYLVWSSSHHEHGRIDDATSDVKFYQEQLDEVEKDLERGVLSEDQAGSVRIEISRRLLAANATSGPSGTSANEPRILFSFGICGFIGIAAAGLYAGLGTFGAPDLPVAERISSLAEARLSRPSQLEAEEIAIPQKPQPQATSQEHLSMVAQLRVVVSERPNDLEGLRLLARQEALIGNYVLARENLERLVRAQDGSPRVDDLALLFDTMLFNANDYISPEAEQVLLRLRERAPDLLLGQFYEGMLEIQSGRPDRAFPIWSDLLNNSPADAPWTAFVRGEMPGVAAATGVDYELPPVRSTDPVPGPSSADIAAASGMSPADRETMIEGMVDQLSLRLAGDGGTAEEWARLIRALTVLGRNDQAKVVASEALITFQSEIQAIALLENLISELGID